MSEYCDLLPSRVRGRSLNRATLWRWTFRGRRDGRALRTVVVGSGRFTCDAWVVEFMEPTGEARSQQAQRPGLDPAERESGSSGRSRGCRFRDNHPHGLDGNTPRDEDRGIVPASPTDQRTPRVRCSSMRIGILEDTRGGLPVRALKSEGIT